MKTKALWIAFGVFLFSEFLAAQSPRTEKGFHSVDFVQDRLPNLAAVTRSHRVKRGNASTCNNNGICEPWLGDSCTTCADCVGNGFCAQLAEDCGRFNFVGGKPGPVYDECLNAPTTLLMWLLQYFSERYAAPGSNIVNDTSPLTPGDGKCNQYLNAGSCGGVPTENCFNDPADCGPCPTIANITDPNIALGICDPNQCAHGVCTAGQCNTGTACQFNCDSAHYGGSGTFTVQSDAVDFVVDANNCSPIATLVKNICPPGGANFASYGLEIPNTLHASSDTLRGSFPAVPDTGGTPVACPSPNGGPPSFRAWLAGAAINNTLFTVGGGICNACVGFGGGEVPTVETYDTSSGAWYSKGPLQTARFGSSSSTVNGKVYALGGTSGNQSQPVSTVEEYDLGTDVWSVKTNMPTPRWKLTSSTVNGVIYTMGGGTSGNQCVPTGAVEAYDPVSNSWTTKQATPTARWGAASDVINGQIYLVGGSQACPQNNVIVSAELDVYDPGTNAWTVLKPMPTPRWDLAAASANGKFYAIGGWDPINQKALDTVEQFDPATSLWTTKHPMPTARSGLVALTINAKIYAFGGVNQFNQLLATLEIYDPASDTWTTAPPPPPVIPPSITLISPTSGNQGQEIPNFTATGSNFDSNATLSFSNAGIVVNSYSSHTPTTIVADITIGTTLPGGAYDVLVTNSDGQKGTLLSGFTVLAGAPPPTITSVWPISGIPGETITNFTLNGTNFDAGAILSFGGHGIKINSQTVVSPAAITAYITVQRKAPLGAQDVVVTNPDGQKGVLAGGFAIVASNGFLAFPLMNKTAFAAAINSVFDHSMLYEYCPESQQPLLVTAYTGEQGSSDFLDKSFATTLMCQLPPPMKNSLYGYKKDNQGTHFAVNGRYVGNREPQFLYYNGHPGFDYRTTDQKTDGSLCPGGKPCNQTGMTPVLAAADGTVVCVNISTVLKYPCTEGPGEIKIDHSNGYFSIYMHLSSNCDSTGSNCVNAKDKVTSGQQIGISGSTGACTPKKPCPHLHFEVRKRLSGSKCLASTCVPVDPYGWTSSGSDPYLPRATNINLWK
jgi:N-acetylneuraminic acid mutarotase